MARIPWEFLDPRPTTDPAWGGLSGTHAETAEVGFGDDPAYDPDDTRFGEEPFDKFEGFEEDTVERVRGHRWEAKKQRAGDVMTEDPRTVGPDATLEEVARVMRDEDCGVVPVVDEGRLIGVITDRDIVVRIAARHLDAHQARARDVMTSDDLAVVDPAADLGDVLRLMEEHRVRRIPVVTEDDHVLGIVAMADLARQADIDFELQDAFLEISADRSFWSRLR